MKKSLLILSSLLAISGLGLTACGGDNSTTTTSEQPSSEPSVASSRDITELPTEDGYFDYVNPETYDEYIGTFVNGKFDGFGTMYYGDGTSYVGEFSEGVREGKGTIYWNTGCIYIGEMHEDLMHGTGYMKWPMGDEYFGEWKNGNPNGLGTKYFMVNEFADTKQQRYNIYIGNMKDNMMDGYGEMSYSFGGFYKGEWVNGIRIGYGEYYWEETSDPLIPWLAFKGQFDYDWIYGEGTLYFKDGTMKTGFFDGNALPLTAE